MLRFAIRRIVQRPLTRTVVTKAPAIENGQKIFTSNGHLHGADNPVRSPAPIASISYSRSARYGQYAALSLHPAKHTRMVVRTPPRRRTVASFVICASPRV